MTHKSGHACPCCDRTFAYSDQRNQHVLSAHLNRASTWASLGVAMARCWCGHVTGSAEDFRGHCEQHGGVRAHYIACSLGID